MIVNNDCKDLDGICCGVISILFRHLPGETVRNHKKENSQCPDRDLKRVPLKYNS
jgi:hypothetical protein